MNSESRTPNTEPMAMADSLAAIKSSIYAVQLGLLEGISTDEQLKAAGRVLTQSEYADVVTERTIVNLCGYPLCKHPLPESFPRKGRYRISLREHKVYDLQETRLFCSTDCLMSSQSFAASLALDRDLDAGTSELAAAFQNLALHDSLQDVHHQDYGSSAIPLAMEDDEETAPQQQQQQDPGTFLLIREQNQVRVEEFHTSGPSDAIEGYLPQKEYRQTHPKKPSDDEGDKKASAFSRHEVKPLEEEGSSSFSGKKQMLKGGSSLRKLASSGKAKDSCSSTRKPKDTPTVSQNSFTSCILVDEGKPTELAAAKESGGSTKPKDSSSFSENSFTSCILVDEKAMAFAAGQQRQKKQNRVSWADHNNMKLVEEAPASSICSSSWAAEGSLGARVQTETEQDGVLGSLSLKSGAILVEEVSELLPNWMDSFEDQGSRGQQDFDPRNDKLECAKALVAALTEAAEAVSHGEAESDEAVARAGISIMSKSHGELSIQLSNHPVEESKGEEGVPVNQLEDVDERNCWYSAPPKNFKPELSLFGTMWMALDEWISAASIAHVYGRDSSEEDNFSSINGKEYLRQATIGNGISVEIERTLSGCISRALPGLVEALRLSIPVSTLEQALGRLLRTMSLVNALPPLSSKQWQVVVMLLLDALSVHRLPVLRTRLLNSRLQLHKVLDSSNITEAEYEVFRDLILPMGRHPEFAAHCGG